MVIRIGSSDDPEGKTSCFEVEESAVLACQTIKHMIEDLEDPIHEIIIPNVTSAILAKVISYLNMHQERNAARVGVEAVNNFDAEFVKVNKNTLFDLIKAANFLDIKGMMNITLKAVANSILNLYMGEIQRFFNVDKEEFEEEVRVSDQGKKLSNYITIKVTPDLKPMETLHNLLDWERQKNNGRALPQCYIMFDGFASGLEGLYVREDIYTAMCHQVVLNNVIYERADVIKSNYCIATRCGTKILNKLETYKESVKNLPMAEEFMKRLILKSSDGKTFEVDESAVLASETIKNMMKDRMIHEIITVPRVTSAILAKVVLYLNMHEERNVAHVGAEAIDKFDDKFVKVDRNTLFDLIKAANYLKIEGLLNRTIQVVSDLTRFMDMGGLRLFYNIEGKFEEEVCMKSQIVMEKRMTSLCLCGEGGGMNHPECFERAFIVPSVRKRYYLSKYVPIKFSADVKPMETLNGLWDLARQEHNGRALPQYYIDLEGIATPGFTSFNRAMRHEVILNNVICERADEVSFSMCFKEEEIPATRWWVEQRADELTHSN